MTGTLLRWLPVLAVAGSTLSLGCSELRGRRLMQQGNEAYHEGRYAEAVAAFQQAEQYLPEYWLLWLNKGYTCRQMLVPGGKTPENKAAVDCALDAFQRMERLKPSDPRARALYIQTLFDAEQYATLAQIGEQRLQQDPTNEDALNGLIQVYSRWTDHLDQALEAYRRKAKAKPRDAEARYALGVFIWQQLFQKGGAADKAEFDPRPDPGAGKHEKKVPPPSLAGEIVGQQRVDMADEAIQYLEQAVELRPKYHEAMTYLNLLYRQKSFAYFDQPEAWQRCIDRAAEWSEKAKALMIQPAAQVEATVAAPNPDSPALGQAN